MSHQRIRTVELQLLRQGPPHNQLLSPLTNYIALCGDHPNTTLNFPLEHDSLRVRLQALRYKDSEETRRIQLADTARVVGEMLAAVPGLISELGQYKNSRQSAVHLSIAMTAAELTLVPFELAHSPPGFPGSGGPLCLQNDFPVCITRRSRNVRFDDLKWDRDPRILMIASDAAGTIPVKQHYSVLRKLVEPYTQTDPLEPESEGSLQHVHDRLVLLANADARSIRQTMTNAINENRPFSYVHVLAHGCRLPRSNESYGVGLHLAGGKPGMDAVDGRRLGQLLTGDESQGSTLRSVGDRSRPNVVTLAVCDSGNTGFDVSTPGGNVVLSLHEAGIPLVVGSQFPLTFGGSVILAESLYSRLLDGEDPRSSLWATRQELFSQNVEKLKSVLDHSTKSQGRHDWCSLLAFAALPANIGAGARRLKVSQQQLRMNSKLGSGDHLINKIYLAEEDTERGKQLRTELAEGNNKIKRFVEQIESAVREYDYFVDEKTVPASRFLGVSGGANKRCAELIYTWEKYLHVVINNQPLRTLHEDEDRTTRWLGRLRKSLRRYQLIMTTDRNQGWAFVQSLFLQRFLTFFDTGTDFSDTKKKRSLDNPVENELFQNWFKAKYICEDKEVRSATSGREKAWHLTDMIELAMLRKLIPRFEGRGPTLTPLKESFDSDNVFKWLYQLDYLSQDSDPATRFAVYAGQRQLRRYRIFAEMLCQKRERDDDKSQESKRLVYKRDYSKWGIELLPAVFKKLYLKVERHIIDQQRDST